MSPCLLDGLPGPPGQQVKQFAWAGSYIVLGQDRKLILCPSPPLVDKGALYEYFLFDANTGFDTPPDGSSSLSQQFTFEEVIRDYDRVIELDPEFQFAWYNRGYVKALNGNYWGAISDLTRATELDPEFAAAFYNKGLMLIYLNLKAVGCQDISMAGELGIDDAYPVLKRYCVK